ncbi:MAG: citrate lyase acyl carrier protein [Christensenellales bacterium]|mgnify:FL=1|nr:citrate lyase acyl carrier protein [Clostridia bacterium]
MELKQPAAAGTLESGDILIELEPNEGKGLNIRLDSTVANQFGKRIKEVISETFAEMGVKDGFVDATDKGALDCTIRARVKAALIRALGKDRNKWE